MEGNMNLGDIVAKLTENPELLKGIINAADSMKSRSGNGERNGDDKRPQTSRWNDGDGGSESDKKPQTSRWNDDDGKGDKKPQTSRWNDDDGEGDKRPQTSRWNNGGGFEKNDRDRLLSALKPYLGESRRSKVELVLKIMKILEITELGGLFKNSD